MGVGKILIAWSGGKDCCLMLDGLLAEGRFEAGALISTVNGSGCLRLHGVPSELIVRQADSLGLPLELVDLAKSPDYAIGLESGLRKHVAAGIQAIAYGDVCNWEVRDWREKVHRRFGLQCIFPLWGRPSLEVARDFIDAGYKALVTAVDATRLPPHLAGRPFDHDFLDELPPGVDPCGDYGEFHTFVHDGPRFRSPLPIRASKPMRVYEEGRWLSYDVGVCDLALVS